MKALIVSPRLCAASMSVSASSDEKRTEIRDDRRRLSLCPACSLSCIGTESRAARSLGGE